MTFGRVHDKLSMTTRTLRGREQALGFLQWDLLVLTSMQEQHGRQASQ